MSVSETELLQSTIKLSFISETILAF